MAPSISPAAADKIRSYIDNATTGDKPVLPGAIVHIVDSKNNTLFSHASSNSTTLSADKTIFLYHSLTKIIGTIAFMQLVDRGLATLDDSKLIEQHLPELWSKKVLTGYDENDKPILVDRDPERVITPRMLMDHTNGTGHTFFNPLMYKYLSEGLETRNEVADPRQTALDAPLMWQPGTHTNYGQGLDWLAVLIERLTGQDLARYLHENVFSKLGMGSIGFEETYGGDATSRADAAFWPRSFKQPDGAYAPMDPTVLATVPRAKAFPEGTYHTYPLGTGLAGPASELARLLAILLPQNMGVDPVSGTRVLSEDAVRQIVTPSLPERLRNDTRVVDTGVPAMCNRIDLSSPALDPEGSFGLGCGVQGAERKLEGGGRGRGEGSVYWYGAANSEFWVDGDRGVVCVVEGNYFPWNDGAWLDFVAGVEGRVYEGLEGA